MQEHFLQMKFEMMQMRTGLVQTTLTCRLFVYLFTYLSAPPTKILHCEQLRITSVSRDYCIIY